MEMHKNLEVILHFAGVEGIALSVDTRGDHIGSLVHVRKQQGGTDAGLGVEPGATIAVPASSDLEIERAIHPVLLCPEYRCQMLRHFRRPINSLSLSLD